MNLFRVIIFIVAIDIMLIMAVIDFKVNDKIANYISRYSFSVKFTLAILYITFLLIKWIIIACIICALQ